METKNYEERIMQVKREIIAEIEELLKDKGSHVMRDPMYVHYVDCEVATTLVCYEIELDDPDSKCGLYCAPDGVKQWKSSEYLYEGDSLMLLDGESMSAILDELKKELREDKLQTLRELVKNAGGSLSFDGNFAFDSFNAEDATDNRCYSNTELLGLRIENGNLIVKNFWEGENSEGDNAIPTYELDRIIEYVREQTEVSPEERLALTYEQQVIVNKIRNNIKELTELGGEIILDHDYGTLFVINAKDEEHSSHPDSVHKTKVDIAELPEEGVIGSGYVYCTSEGIYIK